MVKPNRLDYILTVPTVLRQDGFDVMIYTNDHEPAHVHVWKGGDEILINLGDDTKAPSIKENKGMKKSEARKTVIIVEDNQDFLLERWREIHG